MHPLSNVDDMRKEIEDHDRDHDYDQYIEAGIKKQGSRPISYVELKPENNN
jgi:hypothetical protein